MVSYKSKISSKFFFVNLLTFGLILSFNNKLNSKEIHNTEKSSYPSQSEITQKYLDPKDALKDYIIDSGDELFIEFEPAKELNSFYKVNSEGEIVLPKIYDTYVKGLTISELSNLLEKRYFNYLIEPNIKVFLVKFRDIRVTITGEVKSPGIYTFKDNLVKPNDKAKYLNGNEQSSRINSLVQDQVFFNENSTIKLPTEDLSYEERYFLYNRQSDKLFKIKISDAIRKANGITPKSNLSRIEIVRNIPIGKGGGKKRAIIDLSSFLNEGDSPNDIRLFDGDKINIPLAEYHVNNQIPKSIMSGLNPKFISVNIFGKVEYPGSIKLPSDSTLSDAIDLTGPIKPLSGKIFLIRYSNDGSISKKKISYSASAKRGSKRNPFVQEGDFITVRESLIGKSTGVITGIAKPFVGIKAIRDAFIWD